jgi:uncharacterized protein with HEPN domain
MWRDEAYLLDILIAAKQAKKFSEELTWEKFKTSSLHQHAIMRVLEIIGEASRKISNETKTAHHEVPWNDMIGMRHKLVHDYFRLDLQKIWDTVQQDIPSLITKIAPLVPPDNPS